MLKLLYKERNAWINCEVEKYIFNREVKLQVRIQFELVQIRTLAMLPYNWTLRNQCHGDQIMHRGYDCIQMSTHPYCVPLIVLRIVPRTIHKPIALRRPIDQKFMFMVGPCSSLLSIRCRWLQRLRKLKRPDVEFS